jgi:hypothetical protein
MHVAKPTLDRSDWINTRGQQYADLPCNYTLSPTDHGFGIVADHELLTPTFASTSGRKPLPIESNRSTTSASLHFARISRSSGNSSFLVARKFPGLQPERDRPKTIRPSSPG